MRKVKSFKRMLFVLPLLFIFAYIVFSASNSSAEDVVAYYDGLFGSGEYAIYTDALGGNLSLYSYLSTILGSGSYEYYNSSSDYSYIWLKPQNCNEIDMTCDFVLYRQTPGSYGAIKTYGAVSINMDTNVAGYFLMVDTDNLVINYDESMFSSENEKQQYIVDYVNRLQSSNSQGSIFYRYDNNKKLLIREERTNGKVTRYLAKKINDVVFEYTEEPYSDKFKKLSSGTLTIKTNADIDKNLLSQYLQFININNASFSVDGEVNNGKAFIKMTVWEDGSIALEEKHLITLVKDTENFNLALFDKMGYRNGVNIQADEPSSNKSSYINNYFNITDGNFNAEDGSHEYFCEFVDYNNPSSATISYTKRDSRSEIVDAQIYKTTVSFIGYDNTYSDEYLNKIGREATINSDRLDENSIRESFNGAYGMHLLGCNSDYTFCDVVLYDYDNNTLEIHKVAMLLDNSISDAFKAAFGMKSDGTIDVIAGDGVDLSSGIYTSRYDDETNNSLLFNCDSYSRNNKCRLTLNNYRTRKTEVHEIRYNVVRTSPTAYFSSVVKNSIEVYPGEANDSWGYLGNYGLFAKTGTSLYPGVYYCNASASKCAIVIINNNKNIEIHYSNVIMKEGKSPQFSAIVPGDTVTINSIHKDDEEYIYNASEAYFLSKTKTYTYLSGFRDNRAKVVFNGLESHTVNVEFTQGNDEHEAIVNEVLARIDQNRNYKFDIVDLEFVNSFYYEDPTSFNPGNYNSKTMKDALDGIIDNKHISFFLVSMGGGGDRFMEEMGARIVLYYDGIAYGTTNSSVLVTKKNVIYIPDSTPETKEDYIKAAQKRVDDYLGKNSGVVVSYFEAMSDDDAQYLAPYFDMSNFDGNCYRITYKDNQRDILILKDSSKMQTATFNAADVNNNINVSSDNANYPINTVVSSEILDENSEEGQALMRRLGLEEAQIVDIDLYSPTVGDITNFDGVSFNVSVPIDEEKLGDGDLYAYYVADDGSVEEHPVERDDIMGTFGADHFSTYVIAAKVDDSLLNKIETPKTLDNILKWVVIGGTSMVLIVGGVMFAKNRKRKMNA